MHPIGYHLVLKLRDGRVIAPDAEQRRCVARIVLERTAACCLLAFALVDSHLHLQLVEALTSAMELARRIEIAITKHLGLKVGFQPAYPKAIRDQQHLVRCFDYILRQNQHHGLTWDPYRDGTNLPDLLGMRLLGQASITHVRRFLPRVHRQQLLGYFGLEELQPDRYDLDQLEEAACAAAGIWGLLGSTAAQQQARRAAVAIAKEQLPTFRVARLLGLHRRTVERLAALPVDPRLVEATRLQLALRTIRTHQRQDAPFVVERDNAAPSWSDQVICRTSVE